MFHIDRTKNRISRLEQKRFADLNLQERAHLQEWIIHQPNALGEELLILQKEFAGFEDTRERLDLLALDKEGNLVVIENKLDDSGSDMTWQAIKYTAYVSTLKPAEIIKVYQDYLDRYSKGDMAQERICEFMGIKDLQDINLNTRNSQRMIFIAAKFRREVTAAAMWLISRNVTIQCFRVTPFSFQNELFLDLQQIIPPPEAKTYMIGIASKEIEEAVKESAKKQKVYDLRQQFWAQALSRLREDGVKFFTNVNPTTDHWLNTGSGVSGCPFTMVFCQNEARVELSLSRPKAEENKWLFDTIILSRDEIEKSFGQNLTWLRMDDKKSSRIVFSKEFDGYDERSWPVMLAWLSAHLNALTTAVQKTLLKASSSLQRRGRAEDKRKGVGP